jgi:hypothetical protein
MCAAGRRCAPAKFKLVRTRIRKSKQLRAKERRRRKRRVEVRHLQKVHTGSFYFASYM